MPILIYNPENLSVQASKLTTEDVSEKNSFDQNCSDFNITLSIQVLNVWKVLDSRDFRYHTLSEKNLILTFEIKTFLYLT